jgi:hypothetical protein
MRHGALATASPELYSFSILATLSYTPTAPSGWRVIQTAPCKTQLPWGVAAPAVYRCAVVSNRAAVALERDVLGMARELAFATACSPPLPAKCSHTQCTGARHVTATKPAPPPTPPPTAGGELRKLIATKYGKTHDVSIVRRDIPGKTLVCAPLRRPLPFPSGGFSTVCSTSNILLHGVSPWQVVLWPPKRSPPYAPELLRARDGAVGAVAAVAAKCCRRCCRCCCNRPRSP